MKVVILCGGRGTRAYPFTDYLPKPMVPIHGTPILVHVMRLFAEQGFREFVLSVGYRKEVIRDYFHGKSLEWSVELVDTGADTDTGGRIAGCRHLLGDTFLATYADGLANVDIEDLVAFHRSHDGLATVTCAPLVSQYGTLELNDRDQVVSFREKPVLREHRINIGFFVFDKAVFEHWQGENLEREVFPSLAAGGHVYSFRHEGFFKSLDSYKDQQQFEALLAEGKMPWRRGIAEAEAKRA